MISYEEKYSAVEFEYILHGDFMPAIIKEIEMVRGVIDRIISSEPIPEFENTVLQLEESVYELKRIQNILFNLNSAETGDELQQAAREVSPVLTDFFNDITLNRELYLRIKLAANRSGSYNTEQKRLTDQYVRDFIRNGAELDEASREEFREVSRELSLLSLKFSENLLKATNAYTLTINDEHELSGLPGFVIAAAAAEALSRGVQGWVFTLKAPSYVPFMKYAASRVLRKQMYLAYNSRCFKGDEYDNSMVILKITELRRKKAELLGFSDYASYVLEERMAGTPDAVLEFIGRLTDASGRKAREEFEELQAFARKCGEGGDLMPWDWMYYSEKLKEEMFSVNDEMTKPYFELVNVTKGIFALAKTLYGITLEEDMELQRYNSEVKVYRVYDGDGTFLSLLYMDFFPRESKQGGAWMTNYLEQYKKDGNNIRPQVSLVFNFTRPSCDEPVLLTYDEFRTFLHEFGHALHSILSDVSYMSLSGTNVYLDFVELPSQIMENWGEQKEWLDEIAVHHLTGEKMHGDLTDKILRARNFHSGYAFLRQLNFASLDMAWHTIKVTNAVDIGNFEKAATAKTSMFSIPEGCNFSTIFSHIFGGGYAAGYYGYKWAEVLDADAFSLFLEKGIFNSDVADAFRKYILSRGGTEDPMSLYKKFRGREPSVEPLLKRSGLL